MSYAPPSGNGNATMIQGTSVDPTGISTGKVLTYNGTKLIYSTPSAGSSTITGTIGDIVTIGASNLPVDSGTTVSAITTSIASKLPLTGGTLTGNLSLGTHDLTVNGLTTINQLSFDGTGGLYDNNLGAYLYKSDASNLSFVYDPEGSGFVGYQFDLTSNFFKFNNNAIALNTGAGGASGTGFGKLYMDGGEIVGDVVIKANSHGAGQYPFVVKDSLNNNLLYLSSYGPNNNDFYLGGYSFAQMYNNTAYFASFINSIFRSNTNRFGDSSNPFTAGSGGFDNVLTVKPYYSQSGTAAATDLLINRVVTSVGSGPQLLIDAQVNGVSKFRVQSDGQMRAAGFAAVDSGGSPQATIGNDGNIAANGVYLQGGASGISTTLNWLDGDGTTTHSITISGGIVTAIS